MAQYLAIDDGGVREYIEADTLDEAIAQLRDWMSNAEFDTSEGTVWYKARLYEITEDCDDGEFRTLVHTEKRAFNPPEPDCLTEHEHDWQSPHSVLGGVEENPGVWSNGGGVIIREVCAHCGQYRITDTWAQDPDTGEQGLHSVSYEQADDASLTWAARDN